MIADSTPPAPRPGEPLTPEAQDAAPPRHEGGTYAHDRDDVSARRSLARTDQHTPDTDDAPELAEAIGGEVDPGQSATAPSVHIEPKNP